MTEEKKEPELVVGTLIPAPDTPLEPFPRYGRKEHLDLQVQVDRLKAENAELRKREAAMRETSHMWMVRSWSLEKVLKKAGVCWYGG